MIDTNLLEAEIQKYEGFISDRDTRINFMSKQQKEDKAILKQLRKSLSNLKELADANPEQKKGG